jgi:hypothetical protein
VLEGRLRETFMSSGDGATAAAYAESLLDRAEERLGRNEDPVRLIERDEQEAYLGLAGAAWKLVRAKPTSEVLREALEQLRQDRSFDFTHEDSTFTQLDALMGGGIDFLLAGHTHLERALPRKHGHGYYFNSGTWTRLIKLEESMLGDATQFERVFNAFKAGTMQALDQESGLVLRRPTVVSIWTDGPNVRGELRHVRLNSAGPVLDPVPDSQFIAS